MNDTFLDNTLLAKDVKPTAIRILILKFLLEQETASSLNDIENNFYAMDRVTLYRTLKTFEKKGLVHSINDGSSIKYALCGDDCSEEQHTDTHLHFFCLKCKETICLPKVKSPKLDIPSDFSLEELDLIAKGLCNKCNKQ